MTSPVNAAMKDYYWDWIMAEHKAGRRPTVWNAKHSLGQSAKNVFLMFRVLCHYGYLRQDEEHCYHVARVVDRLDETTRLTYIEPKGGVYHVDRTRHAPKPPKTIKPPKPPPVPSPVTGTWRRTLGGVVTDAHHRRIPRKEFHYRVIACAICGDATIDSMQHHCIGGWRIEADRCICPKCARRET